MAAQTRYDAADMTNPPDNAGVRVPPPLLYALAVLGGYALNRYWPLATPAAPSGATSPARSS
jgi:hypothetical protein